MTRACTTCAYFSRDKATGRPVLRCGYFGSTLRPGVPDGVTDRGG